MTALKSIYGDQDPRDVACYTIRDAARFLRLPNTTLNSWVSGRVYVTRKDGKKRGRPVVHLQSRNPPLLSFWNLAEAYVVAGITRQHGVALPSLRRALDYVKKELDVDRPLIQQDFLTNGVDLFVEKLEEQARQDPGIEALINASRGGQMAARKLLQATLKRVDRDTKGLITRIYPWVNDVGEAKHIEIDPRRAFGRPVVKGTVVPAESLAERFRSGDSRDEIAKDFRLDPEVVESALRWEMSAAAA